MKARESLLVILIITILSTFGLLLGGYNLLTSVRVTPAWAQYSPTEKIARGVGATEYFGYQTLTPNSTTASSLTVPAGANCGLISIQTANVRYWPDGTAPTTTTGHLIGPTGVGQTLWLSNRHQLLNFKVISVSTHGVLSISYGN